MMNIPLIKTVQTLNSMAFLKSKLSKQTNENVQTSTLNEFNKDRLLFRIGIVALSSLLLTACGGGNYDENVPIIEDNGKDSGNHTDDGNNTGDDTDNNTDNNNGGGNGDNNNGNGNNGKDDDLIGKRKIQYMKRDFSAIPVDFGAGDVIYLDKLFKLDSGLPITYEIETVPMPGSMQGSCRIIGEKHNILQTSKKGFCYFSTKQAGNAEYLPYETIEEIKIPIKCPDKMRPEEVESNSVFPDYKCVPNYLAIDPPQDTPIGIVGKIFRLTINGEKLDEYGDDLQISLEHCDNIGYSSNWSGKVRYLSCTPKQAGTENLRIHYGNQELLNTPIIFQAFKPIPVVPISKTGVTHCINTTEDNLDCQSPQLAKFKDVGQDGEIQSGVAHDYQLLNVGADSCIQDKATGRIWERKTDDGGLRDKDWQYFWYSSNGYRNLGYNGTKGLKDYQSYQGICGNTLPDGLCNTEAYIQALNQSNYCGYNDWRLPTATELVSLLDYAKIDNPPMINQLFTNTMADFYFSSSKVDYDEAVKVNFLSGITANEYVSVRLHRKHHVRAVRTD